MGQRLGLGLEGGEDALLFDVVSHEKLTNAKTVGGDSPYANEKRVGTGAASETGSFRIEKGPALRGTIGDAIVTECVQQACGQFAEGADVSGPVLLGLEVLTEFIANDAAFRPFFDEATRTAASARKGCGSARDIFTGILPVNRGHALFEPGKLCFSVQH